MTNPKHIPNGLSREEAIAPYNFVELPDQVVRSQDEQEPVTHNQYHEGRHTGRIECMLTTSSPLYVRCALTLDQFQQGEKERQEQQKKQQKDYREAVKNTPDFFYTHDKERPVIPGSSLRGMLRTLVEIASFGKIEQVTDQQRYFFRAVAAKQDDPLAQPYKSLLKNVRAGYLVNRQDRWYIRPAQTIGSDTFIKVRERDVPPTVKLTRLNHGNYKPQYIEISYTHKNVRDKRTRKDRTVVDKIGQPGVYEHQGWLVTSGNMLETGKEKAVSPRRNHCVVLAPHENAQLLEIDDTAITDYRNGLTDFQKEDPFDTQYGMLENGRPVFYCQPARGQPVTFFGQSPNFRIPYRFNESERASSPYDFIPDELKSTNIVDLAEAIFGYVRRKKDEQEQARAGRVFVSDATLNQEQENVWLREEPITPRILATPKPTTFQHYLVQTEDDKAKIKHYASKPGEETVIRGHKLYWHKGDVGGDKIEDSKFLQEKTKEDTQHTRFKPVKSGISFTFTIHFENLSKVELGALLWVLNLATQDQYRLKLGMGKPLGMGAVKIVPTLVLSNREQRYTTLFNGDWWETGDAAASNDDMTDVVDQFRSYVQEHAGIAKLEESPRIQMLLAMLSWPGPEPVEEKTRYMEIERKPEKGGHLVGHDANEYKERFVLPDPLDVGNTSRQSKQQNTTAKTSQSVPSPGTKPKPTKGNIPQVGDTVTGNRKGFQRGKKGPVVVKINQVPSNVQGIIPAEYAKGNASGGVKAEVIDQEKEGNTIILYLKPVKKEQGEK